MHRHFVALFTTPPRFQLKTHVLCCLRNYSLLFFIAGSPAKLRLVFSSSSAITLTWESTTSETTNYSVEVRCCEESTWVEAHCTANLIGRGCAVSDTTVTVIGLESDKEYYFRIYAVYNNWRSTASSTSEAMKTKSGHKGTL